MKVLERRCLVTKKPVESNAKSPKRRPELTPEARDNRLISLAIDLVEKQLEEGTASAMVIVHYLKLAAQREEKELELIKARKEIELLNAKTESLESSKRVEDLYSQAMAAMKRYAGQHDTEI